MMSRGKKSLPEKEVSQNYTNHRNYRERAGVMWWWKSSEGGNNLPRILFRYTSLPSSSSISSFFSSAEIPFKCLEGEQMSKTTFQIPMCVLVPILSARLCVCVCEARRRKGSEEKYKVTNICEKTGS